MALLPTTTNQAVLTAAFEFQNQFHAVFQRDEQDELLKDAASLKAIEAWYNNSYQLIALVSGIPGLAPVYFDCTGGTYDARALLHVHSVSYTAFKLMEALTDVHKRQQQQ